MVCAAHTINLWCNQWFFILWTTKNFNCGKLGILSFKKVRYLFLMSNKQCTAVAARNETFLKEKLWQKKIYQFHYVSHRDIKLLHQSTFSSVSILCLLACVNAVCVCARVFVHVWRCKKKNQICSYFIVFFGLISMPPFQIVWLL